MAFGGGSGNGALSGASDVVINNPITSNFLGYVSGTSKWTNAGLGGVAALANGGGVETLSALGAKTGAVTFSLAVGNVFSVTLTGTITPTITGATAGAVCSFGLHLKQDATGSRTVAWPASVKWAGGVAPTLSTGANALDIVVLESIDGGVTWYGSLVGTNFS